PASGGRWRFSRYGGCGVLVRRRGALGGVPRRGGGVGRVHARSLGMPVEPYRLAAVRIQATGPRARLYPTPTAARSTTTATTIAVIPMPELSGSTDSRPTASQLSPQASASAGAIRPRLNQAIATPMSPTTTSAAMPTGVAAPPH